MTTLIEEITGEVQKRISAIGTVPGVRLVAVGLRYTMVELDNDILGLCYTPRPAAGSCSTYAGAGTLSEKSALELSALALSRNLLDRSVGIAAITALSQFIMAHDRERYQYAQADFLDLLPLNGGQKKVGMVGHIGPFIPVLSQKAASLVVLDDNPGLDAGFQSGFQSRGYRITRDITELADADVLIITGSSSAVGDFDEVLEVASSASFIGVVGPSAGWLPDPAFRRGIHAVAGTRIVEIPSARRVILEGGGTRQFSRYGEKYTVLN